MHESTFSHGLENTHNSHMCQFHECARYFRDLLICESILVTRDASILPPNLCMIIYEV